MTSKYLAILTLTAMSPLWTIAAAAQARSGSDVLVTVTNKQYSPARPVSDARIWLTFQDGTEHVTDDRQRTNQAGQTRLRISPSAAERFMRLEVTEAHDLMIYLPADGVLGDKVPSVLQVVMLPKGSPAFMEPAQIEAMMNRLSSATVKVRQLKAELDQAKSGARNEKPDFDVALEGWAAEHGLAYAELDQKLRLWAQDIATHQEGKSDSQLAEAELGLRHYEAAALLFEDAAGKSRTALQRDWAEKEEALRKTRQDLRDDVHRMIQSATALQSAHLEARAAANMEKARQDAFSTLESYPEDAEIHNIWVQASLLALYQKWSEGRAALSRGGDVWESARLFSEAIAESKRMLTLIKNQDDPQYRLYLSVLATTGSIYLAEVSDSKTATELRKAAVTDARAAVNAWDKQKDPGNWATLQTIYAMTLALQAGRGLTDSSLTISEALKGIDEAIASFAVTLDFYKSSGDVSDWASVKTTIGEMLQIKALDPEITKDAQGALLDQAAANLQEALEATDQSKNPKDWLTLKINLGKVDGARAAISDGSRAADLWTRATNSLSDALKAISKDEDPSSWAGTEDDLALLLENEGKATPGSAGATLLNESSNAYAEVTHVFTKQSFPQRWARAQASRAGVLLDEGSRVGPDKAAALYTESAAASKAAL